MRIRARTKSSRPPKAKRQAANSSWRDRLAVLLAIITFVVVGSALFFTRDKLFLMPGPLTSSHGAIENCGACHTKSGSGKLSWLHGLVAGDPLADSKACLTCHKMTNTALNAHGASVEILEQSTRRLTKLAAGAPVPQSARTQNMTFPTANMVARGLFCATCHQEHQGITFNLNKISNEQCRSCHVLKFDSFDGHHPKFENYPFNKRTQIIFDHVGHFGKHFLEVAKTEPKRRIPDTCSTCHNIVKDKRVMAVAPFEQTCTACHLDQIVGKERVSGPKGVAFLTLPSLDLKTLKNKRASIGEWPAASEAELTPFMKIMIGRNKQGRALIETVDRLNLQDLSGASNDQIKAVSNLVWEIKRLFHALIRGKASDVLADLEIGGAKLNSNLFADLTANIPRDIIISAQQQWLPNLGNEMANRPATGSASPQVQSGSESLRSNSQRSLQAAGTDAPQSKGVAGKADAAKADDGKERLSTESKRPALEESRLNASDTSQERSGSDTRQATEDLNPQAAGSEAASEPRRDPQACIMAVFGVCVLTKNSDAVKSEGTAKKADAAKPKREGGKQKSFSKELPPASQVGLKEVAQAAQREGPAGNTKPTNARPGKKTSIAAGPPPAREADQTDDLLNPTEEELRGIAAPVGGAAKAARPDTRVRRPNTANARSNGSKSAASEITAARSQNLASSGISIESDVDSETWAEYGGWYRQDYAIFYRPTGHKDKFIYSWLVLTGPHAPKGDNGPAAAVFDYLTSKDAQGACAKCHSVDDIPGKGRIINFAPPSAKSKQGRFTNFIHEPHLSIVKDRGCLTCHSLEGGRPYLKNYEHGNPQRFVSNFSAVEKNLCQTCHTSGKARQDCLLCHSYHVNGTTTPIMNTRVPNR